MTLELKVEAVQKLFEKLDAEINTFQNQTHLKCQPGCGKCCTKPDIEAFRPCWYVAQAMSASNQQVIRRAEHKIKKS